MTQDDRNALPEDLCGLAQDTANYVRRKSTAMTSKMKDGRNLQQGSCIPLFCVALYRVSDPPLEERYFDHLPHLHKLQCNLRSKVT